MFLVPPSDRRTLHRNKPSLATRPTIHHRPISRPPGGQLHFALIPTQCTPSAECKPASSQYEVDCKLPGSILSPPVFFCVASVFWSRFRVWKFSPAFWSFTLCPPHGAREKAQKFGKFAAKVGLKIVCKNLLDKCWLIFGAF